MIAAYIFTFCQVVIGFSFTVAFITKLLDFRNFIGAMHNYRLLPAFLVPFSAVVFSLSELLVVVLLFRWPTAAFRLSAALLLLFSLVLITVLQRKLQIPCHCFGSSQTPVTSLDLVRNAGLLVCAGAGLGLDQQAITSNQLSQLTLVIIGFAAIAFVLIWTQLGEIYQLFETN